MQILLRGLSAEGFRSYDVSPTSLIGGLKESISVAEGIPLECLRLCYGLQQLCDDQTFWDSSICDCSTVHACVDLLGGAKKRKKKTFLKPKKPKHKKKKVKLAVLKYYKVDGNNRVLKLRKECVQCGKGVFMAMHSNRSYCGRCNNTWLMKDKEAPTSVV